MTFTSNTPQSNENISISQPKLLANNEYLANLSTRSGIIVMDSVSKNISTGGYYNLPNGLLIQYAVVTNAANPGVLGETNIDFLTPWTVGIISLQLTGISNTDNGHTLWYSPNSANTTLFQVSTDKIWESGIYYFAIGI